MSLPSAALGTDGEIYVNVDEELPGAMLEELHKQVTALIGENFFIGRPLSPEEKRAFILRVNDAAAEAASVAISARTKPVSVGRRRHRRRRSARRS